MQPKSRFAQCTHTLSDTIFHILHLCLMDNTTSCKWNLHIPNMISKLSFHQWQLLNIPHASIFTRTMYLSNTPPIYKLESLPHISTSIFYVISCCHFELINIPFTIISYPNHPTLSQLSSINSSIKHSLCCCIVESIPHPNPRTNPNKWRKGASSLHQRSNLRSKRIHVKV